MGSPRVQREKLLSLTLNLKSLNLSHVNKLTLPSKHSHKPTTSSLISILGMKWRTASNPSSSPSLHFHTVQQIFTAAAIPGAHHSLPFPPTMPCRKLSTLDYNLKITGQECTGLKLSRNVL